MEIILLGLVLIGALYGAQVNGVDNMDAFFKWDSLFKKYGAKHGVPWKWLKTIAMTESNLGQAKSVARGIQNPNDIEGSVSFDGKSWGIMQMTLPTARMFNSVITEVALNDPEVSIELAAQYLKKTIQLKGISDKESIFRSYNGGWGWRNSSAKALEMTADYWEKSQKNLAEVMRVHGGEELATS